jgi:hypothetical protein
VKRIEFAPEARAELDGAADEYEREREGRGLRFYIAVERATQAAAALPEAGPLLAEGGYDFAATPLVRAWLERLWARPAWQRAEQLVFADDA